MRKAFPIALAFLNLIAVIAPAQNPGPDVIVGDLYESADYGVSGAKAAWAVGTISCNMGDTPLTWIDCGDGNNPACRLHPVISQNLYRLSNGRYEQIGQAWLKHGFCALQGTVCSACTPGGNCDALYPGCSDPYSAGLNGSQGGLGPKAEVNAATGTFPYPWLNNGSGSGTLFKRLQANTADIGVAGALYFVSSMYVQPEDASAGNDDNNQSYRRCTFSGSSMSLQGSTEREKPAIFAWRDHGGGVGVPDAGVHLFPVDVPKDGRFWIGAKVTNLGGGQWHYEYAIQNLNSDRSGQAFSIPIPAGATVTNVGFMDVDYHSGEPYALTNWTSSVAGGAVTWSTQTHAQNVNANALRWDTIYNFRFDCNVPPAGALATLTLFKPGTPSAMTLNLPAPSADGQQHPFNDSCANASGVVEGSYGFDTTGATTDGPDEPTSCNQSGYTNVGADVWYLYQAPCSGTITVRTCGSSYDTKIAVYNGPDCPITASAIACNDDSGTCGVNSLQSMLTFTAVEGNEYLIRVGGYNALAGPGTLTIEDGCGPQPPANDACGNATWLSAGVAVDGTTALSSNDGTANCGSSESSPDVWFRYRPASSASVTVTTCFAETLYDTVVSVHTGTCGALTQVGCNDDASGCGLSSTVTMNMTANVTYYIRVAGYQGATGGFRIRVTGGGGVAPPVNDDCANRSGIALGVTAFTTVGSSTDGPTHAGCNQNGSNQITNDIWFNLPSQDTGTLRISLCNAATFNTRLAVYDGAGCTNLDARLLACNDNGSGCGTTSQIDIPVVTGQNYTIRLGGTSGATGTGNLTLSMVTSGPSISQHPQPMTVCVGQPASFTVVASGSGLSYQWRRNTVNLSNGGAISGATSATLSINPAAGANAGSYDVVVTNAGGSVTSNAAALTVNTAPSIGTNPSSQTVTAGDPVTFTVVASGTAPLTYQWRKNTVNIGGATSASFAIASAQEADEGAYDCVVTNSCGNATSTAATLTVDPVACPGDTDGDGDVDLSDLSNLLGNFGTTGGATLNMGDMDGDGDVDLSDLSVILANFGTTC